MRMVVYPGFATHSIGDRSRRRAKVAAILGKQNQWLIENETINRSLLAVRTVVRVRARVSLGLRNWSPQMVKKLDNIA
jgi:hypothetical protein